MENNPEGKNGRARGPKNPIGTIAAAVIFISIVSNIGGLSDMGIGIAFIMPFIFAISIGVVIFSVVKSAKNQSGSQQSRPTYRAPSSPYRQSAPASPSSGHLCDEGQHQKESAGFDTMEEMQAGYKRYGNIDSAGVATPTPAAKYRLRSRKLTAEEYRRKQSELSDLLDAGIITRDEYASKLNEYKN